MDAALQALLLAAGLAAPSLPPAPAARPRPVAAPIVEIARLHVRDVAAAQARGAVTESLGGAELRLAAGFDFNGDSWLKVSAFGETKGFSWPQLSAGADATVGGLALRVSAKGDAVTVAAGGASAKVSYMDLIRSLFKAARHVKPHEALDYAVVVEDGSDGVPASVCLIRGDSEGDFFVTYRKPEQLRQPQWFAAVDGVLKGFHADGSDLVFIEKRIEQMSAVAGSAAGFGPAPARLVRAR